MKSRWLAILLIIFAGLVGLFVYGSEQPGRFWHRPFVLGLDLEGGSHLIYAADVSKLGASDINEAMASLREVIERRINVFGVSEPLVQVEKAGNNHRLIVELPGITDLREAEAIIRATPLLEFRVPQGEGEKLIFLSSALTGRYLKKATVQFPQNSLGPSIGLDFNNEGEKIFAELTKKYIGQPIGIFLDGELLSAPVVREEIRSGQAEITGQFTLDEAKTLVRNLNLGALPVPISLISTETIGATLGDEALDRGIRAGAIGLAVIALFMLLWYRLPGLVAVVSVSIYVALMLAIFKLLPVTLTAAGIAGFILSVGMAVDANILIFERTKEEIKKGSNIHDAIIHGFSRAWLSIRDSNLSSLISALILFWFGTSLIKGFALVLAIGVLVSMLTAITITRTFLRALGVTHANRLTKFLFSSGPV